MTDKIILLTDPEAAEYRTDIKGWVSRHGTYHGDYCGSEGDARYDGATHVLCRDCGVATEKHYSLCGECCKIADAARYAAMPRKAWDGKAMLYSEVLGDFFDGPDEAADWIEGDQVVTDLRLVICEPEYVPELNDEYVTDLMPDRDVPAEVKAAMKAFNAAVKGVVISWSPGKFALEVER